MTANQKKQLKAQLWNIANELRGKMNADEFRDYLLAKIVTLGKTRIKSVYDPTCGSGSLLLRIAREVDVKDYYGLELNRTTYNLARMNMILHGVHYRDFDIRQEDTLERPQHEGMNFEAVVANPPFSHKWSGNKLFESDDRFSQYGRLAPKSKADYAFVQHMLHHLDDNGTMAVVLPHGVLSAALQKVIYVATLLRNAIGWMLLLDYLQIFFTEQAFQPVCWFSKNAVKTRKTYSLSTPAHTSKR